MYRPQRPDYYVNEWIRAREMLVIDPEGENLGILSKEEALRKAQERGLDLVLVAANANPPVARIIDFSKFRYEKSKAEAKKRKIGKAGDMKQLRFKPIIGEHDLQIRINKARGFIEEGNKVKFIVPFMGRLIARKDIGEAKLNLVAESLSDIAEVDKERWMEGKFMMLIIRPKKK